MDNRAEVRDFLATRRAKTSPEQAGLGVHTGRRRVPGLRREEVALLAGVSVDYYTRIEKGHLQGVSDSVLNAIAEALRLDEAERDHLHNLARAARASSRSARRQPASKVRPSILRLLDSMTMTAAFVRTTRLDVVAANALGRAFFAPVFELPERQPNLARFAFLDPAARSFYPNWAGTADTTVAILRTAAGNDPFDRQLTDLVGELATRSDEFRTRWAQHDVRLHRTGTKSFVHPMVGELELDYDVLELPADTGLILTAYSAQPGTESADKLAVLASWSADPAPPPARSDRRPTGEVGSAGRT